MNVLSLFDGISCGMVALEREREREMKLIIIMQAKLMNIQ